MRLHTAAIRRALRFRLSWRRAGIAAVVLILTSALLDRAGAFGYEGDDWRRFDRAQVRVTSVTSGDLITIEREGHNQQVRMIGIDAPDPGEHWHEHARRYTEARIAGRVVMLKLDSTETRDARGRLLAYVYFSPGDNINLDLVRNGLAYADRRVRHTHQAQFEQLETQARLKDRGLWKDLSEDQMPRWRQQWLREQLARRRQL